jgi:hypothetical protein
MDEDEHVVVVWYDAIGARSLEALGPQTCSFCQHDEVADMESSYAEMFGLKTASWVLLLDTSKQEEHTVDSLGVPVKPTPQLGRVSKQHFRQMLQARWKKQSKMPPGEEVLPRLRVYVDDVSGSPHGGSNCSEVTANGKHSNCACCSLYHTCETRLHRAMVHASTHDHLSLHAAMVASCITVKYTMLQWLQ